MVMPTRVVEFQVHPSAAAMALTEEKSELDLALRALRMPLRRVLIFSLFTNLLVLAPTVYMLEVYGRVVDSRSSSTLLMLTLLVLGAYVVMELLEWVRSSLLHQCGQEFDSRFAQRLFGAIFRAQLQPGKSAAGQAIGNMQTLRNFVASPAMLALIDVPFGLLFFLLVYLIDLWLGLAAIFGGLCLLLVGALTQRGTRTPLMEASKAAAAAQGYANGMIRNAQAIEAMGMMRDVYRLWLERQKVFLQRQAEASDHAGVGTAASKFIQTLQGSLLLGLGCWLTLQAKMDPTGAAMIVASILGARALTPMALLIGQWRQVEQARDAYLQLDQFLRGQAVAKPGMPLPPPQGRLNVEHLSAAAPGSPTQILRGVNFALRPGDILAVVGPSASGKTTLARLLVGVWPASSGKVRLDGVDMHTWNKVELGPHIGYLPQNVELLEGTVAENIARFGEVDMALVEEAARAVGLHEIIATLPDGYDTQIGVDGAFLSGGQRQRVALARAFFGGPRFVVLDEPNSSLDEDGDRALLEALRLFKSRGVTLVIITHRTSVLAVADHMLILREGQMQAFGPRDEVLAAVKRAVSAATGAQSTHVAPPRQGVAPA